ncbi:GntR family transcriptional regulator [Micromonospora sp. CA-111912]|uniref:GntR family transcriptional regulator n=1 Tax=Micromonospora sp. CA-111912 TaxID=3239955 RepID=UPI003D92415D
MATRPPHYRRVADDIEQRIRSGEYPGGHQLPSVSELGEIYNIARSTAYRAVKELHTRNLVYGQQGQGVFVTDEPETHEPQD